MEDLETVDYHQQGVDAYSGAEFKAIMVHNRDEDQKLVEMVVERVR